MPEVRAPRGSIVGDLHDAGLLLAMVPEFRPVTGRVHHDVYHVYTVDVHSVSAVDRLRQLARGELAHEYPLASRLAAEIARPRPLFLATLLHDVGKGYPDASGSRKNHSRAGAELCDRILPRLGVSGEDIDEARALVRDHLLMYHVATHRDLDDIATIEEFCQNLRGREGLRNLYLLTMADVTTTSPTAMTSWKARMLEELYFASESYLMGKKTREDAERIARVVEAVRATWKGPTEPLEALLGSLPERYLLANRPESIAAHALAVAARGSAARARRARSVAAPGGRRAVHRGGRPAGPPREHRRGADRQPAGGPLRRGLLAPRRRRAGGARPLLGPRSRRRHRGGRRRSPTARSRPRGRLLRPGLSASELLRIRTGSLSPWRDRPSPDVPTEVLFDNRASPRHTIVEVYAKDRRGLLHRLARTLYELRLSITLSKINTEGTRVADVFYVSELDGSKVAPGARHQQIHDALLRAVDE